MRWPTFGSRRQRARERAEEMRAHLEEYADQLVARGLSPEAARREARLKFGNPRVKLEEVEAMHRLAAWDSIGRDLRYTIRTLRHSRGFTAIVLAVLALGIGTATAIFSVVDAIVLRGLPFHDAHRLVDVSSTRVADGSARPVRLAVPDVVDYRARQDVFDGGLAATAPQALTLRAGGQSEPVYGTRVTADIFDVLGVSPQLGRPFSGEHEMAGNDDVALISDGLWRRRFGADVGLLGQQISFSVGQGSTATTRSVTVLGVLPRGVTYPVGLSMPVDIWTPFAPLESQKVRGQGRASFVSLVGRLKRGVTIEQAQARMNHLSASLATEHPAWFRNQGVMVRPLRTTIAGGDGVRTWMLMLLAAVGCVLWLAALNVANLLLARATTRSREGRIRAALGATRWQLARTALLESLLLSLGGSALGVLLAYWGIDLLRATIPASVPLVGSVAVDFRVLAVAGGAALAIGLLLGILPALQLSRPSLAIHLRRADRSHTPGTGTHRVRGALLVVEVALAVLLLVGSGLFASSFIRVMNVDLGMDYRNVLSINVPDRVVDDVLERLRAVPGVEAVGSVDQNEFLGDGTTRYSLKVPGREAEYWDDDAVHPHFVTPGYLAVMRLSLLEGRWFTASDVKVNEQVAVLSAEAARRYFPDRNPIGVTVGMGGRQVTVVGVVGSVRLNGPETAFKPEIYLPAVTTERTMATPAVLIRTQEDPGTNNVIPNIKTAIWSVDPTLPLPVHLETIAGRMGTLVAPRRFNMVILAMFGVMGTIIAAIGIYGVMAFIVTQRTQEIGIRMALGAEAARVQRSVLWSASQLLLLGLAIGLATAAALAGSLEGLLFQVQPRDLTIYAAASAVLLVAGLAAAYIPARRASRVDPLVALRAE